jgi:hypothetical protein
MAIQHIGCQRSISIFRDGVHPCILLCCVHLKPLAGGKHDGGETVLGAAPSGFGFSRVRV